MGSICTSHSISSARRVKTIDIAKPSVNVFDLKYSISQRTLRDAQSFQVRLCRNNSTQRVFVVKTSSSYRNFDCVEAKILQKLRHPHIIGLIDYFQNSKNNYIVLEFAPEGDLSELLRRINKLPEKTAADLIVQVLSALSYCHAHGVTHRDIKPENILIDSIGKRGIYCKIADFDSAYLAGHSSKGVYGTLYYEAPEIFSGVYNEKVDVWSCGVLLYELLTGKHLFIGGDLKEIQERIHAEEIKFDSSLSGDLRDLLSKMLNRDPNARISAHEACQHVWIRRNMHKSVVPSTLLDFTVQTPLILALEEFIITNITTRKEQKVLRSEFSQLDVDCNGSVELCRLLNHSLDNQRTLVNYKEFLHASIPRELKTDRGVVFQFFQELDLTHKGTLSLEDFALSFSKKNPGVITELEGVLKNSSITFEEFYSYISRTVN